MPSPDKELFRIKPLESAEQTSRRLVAESGLGLYGKRRQRLEDLILLALRNQRKTWTEERTQMLSALERAQQDRNSWRRVSERLETEKQIMELRSKAMTDCFRPKQLTWQWLVVNGVRFWSADSPVGSLNWRIYELTTGWHLNPSGRSGIDCASPEECKQLAEQHWREYIKQALEPVEESK